MLVFENKRHLSSEHGRIMNIWCLKIGGPAKWWLSFLVSLSTQPEKSTLKQHTRTHPFVLLVRGASLVRAVLLKGVVTPVGGMQVGRTSHGRLFIGNWAAKPFLSRGLRPRCPAGYVSTSPAFPGNWQSGSPPGQPASQPTPHLSHNQNPGR